MTRKLLIGKDSSIYSSYSKLSPFVKLFNRFIALLIIGLIQMSEQQFSKTKKPKAAQVGVSKEEVQALSENTTADAS